MKQSNISRKTVKYQSKTTLNRTFMQLSHGVPPPIPTSLKSKTNNRQSGTAKKALEIKLWWGFACVNFAY